MIVLSASLGLWATRGAAGIVEVLCNSRHLTYEQKGNNMMSVSRYGARETWDGINVILPSKPVEEQDCESNIPSLAPPQLAFSFFPPSITHKSRGVEPPFLYNPTGRPEDARHTTSPNQKTGQAWPIAPGTSFSFGSFYLLGECFTSLRETQYKNTTLLAKRNEVVRAGGL
jgi:hypothetical protein